MPASTENQGRLLNTLNGVTLVKDSTYDIPVLIRRTWDAGAQRGLLKRVAEEGA